MSNRVKAELGKRVVLTIACAIFAVIGLIQIMQSQLLPGALIAIASVVFWSMACSGTDLAEAIGSA